MAQSEGSEGDGGIYYGWIMPVCKLFGEGSHNWARRSYLRRCLENPRFPHGRTLDALRRAAGESDTEDGRERTRELLRHVKRGRKHARILKRGPGEEEMWGLREE
jgi:hypothetical protein